jgi:hypothetical protein
MDPVTISMLVSAGVSAVQAYNANADQKRAQMDAQRLGAQLRAIQEADKVSGLQVPTLGAELARQSLGQQMAMTVNALTGAGAAGVLGGIPGASAMGANAALEIAADLQRQQAARDQFVASAQQGIEGRRVQAEREMVGDQLQGAQLQAYASGTERNQAIATGVSSLGKAAAAEIGAQPLFEKQETVMGPDTVRKSEYYQFQPQLAPEGVEIPKDEETKIFTTNQPTTNLSGDMYSGLGINKANLITF